MAAAGALAFGAAICPKDVWANNFTTHPKPAFLGGIPDEAAITAMLEHDFPGMEVRSGFTLAQAVEAKKLADRLGFRFHSVMGGASKEGFEAAAALGADTVLCVPGRVGGVPMPEAWEFDLEFDEKTNVLKRAVAGDNTPYAAYIQAHNAAMEAARRSYDTLLPLAEAAGIVIAQENVWNNMWVKPEFAANFVLGYDTPWLQAYVDLGNHRKYSNPVDWLKCFGKNVRRIHLKDFKLNENGHGGTWCKLGEGSVPWREVRQEMERIGYDKWCTIEPEGGVSMTLDEQQAAAKKILSGEGF